MFGPTILYPSISGAVIVTDSPTESVLIICSPISFLSVSTILTIIVPFCSTGVSCIFLYIKLYVCTPSVYSPVKLSGWDISSYPSNDFASRVNGSPTFPSSWTISSWFASSSLYIATTLPDNLV